MLKILEISIGSEKLLKSRISKNKIGRYYKMKHLQKNMSSFCND